MFDRAAHYGALRAQLTTAKQRQDSASQQVLDLMPVFAAAGLVEIVQKLNHVAHNGLIASECFASQQQEIAAHAVPPNLSLMEQVGVAKDIANLLGCYDAADTIGAWQH